MSYEDFIASKRRAETATGHQPGPLNEHLFDFQHAIVSWAIRKGRAAIFADTGLGKTLMQLSWAQDVQRHTGGKVLILAPLAVSEQTINEGRQFGIEVTRCPADPWTAENEKAGIYITNYERMDHAFESAWSGIVLDESSILKAHDGKTRTRIIEYAQSVQYRLSCTATPSPNDFEELGNQCEFLGVMSRTEMLATYFVNDTGNTGTWRLKGWGASKFWEWMGTWAVVVRNPADIGFDGSRYELPPIEYHEHTVGAVTLPGELFTKPAMTMLERRKAQRESIEDRCRALAELVNSEPDEPWLIWCHLNAEAELLASMIEGSVNVQGSDHPDDKVSAVAWFARGECICNTKRFRDKLAKTNQGNAQCQKKPISSDTTEKTKSAESEKRETGSKKIKGIEKNTCGSTSNKTETSSDEPPNSRKKSTGVGGKNTQSANKQETQQEQKRKSGKTQTPKKDLLSDSGNTALPLSDTSSFSNPKEEAAQSVDHPIPKTSAQTKCSSTTATTQAKSVDCSAHHAISESGSSKTTPRDSNQQRCICGAQKTGRVLISKAKIFGYGLNLQHCARMAFVGLDDSFEKFYQAVRRCYRFGQKREVQVHVFVAENEGQVLANLKRKEANHHEMSAMMVEHMREIMDIEIKGQIKVTEEYREDIHEGEGFTVRLGDCVKGARKMADNSIDYSVFSPPFADLFVYSNSDHDMGNCKDDAEFVTQLRFLIDELFRVTKPGRNVSFHCMNLPTTKMRQGYIGLRDFRGDLIRAFQDAGFIYHSEVAIWKDPVVAMQRTKALGLLHKTIRDNASMSRMGLPDYVVTMRKPGDCEVRVTHGDDLPVQMWQKYASPIWDDINQSRTLNKLPARDENDEKHMCPLQLDVIERCIHLWTNPGDLIYSPFTGIGSEGYCAIRMGRKFVGDELKPQYWELAIQNIEDARIDQGGLFEGMA